MLFMLSSSAISQKTWKEILKASEDYYLNKKKATVNIVHHSKNILKSDTNTSVQVFYYNAEGGSLGKWVYDTSDINYLLFHEKKTYYVRRNREAYYVAENSADEKLAFMPFWNPKAFFKEYTKFGKWASVKIEESSNDYIINLSNKVDRTHSLFIKKEDFSIRQYIDIITHRRGTQYRRYDFLETGTTSTTDAFLKNLDSIITSYTLETDETYDQAYEAYEKRKKELINSKLNKDQLLTALFEDKRGSYQNKYLLLDYFHQACLPCIKAIPDLNTLKNKYDSSLAVIGVDIIPGDVGHKESFIKKYKVSYYIVDGKQAKEVKETMPEIRIAFPTMVLISPDGTIIKIMDGYSKKHYRWLNDYFDKIKTSD